MNGAKIFISYAHEDMTVARAVDQWLRDRGYQVLRDETDFGLGSLLTDEIERCIQASDRVFVIYSERSRNRDYPKLERRIAQEFARQGKREPFLVYFRIDEAPLPLSEADRLAVNAYSMVGAGAFEKACTGLERSITRAPAIPQFIDYQTLYKEQAPWEIAGDQLQALIAQLREGESSFVGRITTLQQIAALRHAAALSALESIEADSFYSEGERAAARMLLEDAEAGRRTRDLQHRLDEERRRRGGYSVGQEAYEKAKPESGPALAAMDAIMSIMWCYRSSEKLWEQSANAIIKAAGAPPSGTPEDSKGSQDTQ